LIRWVGGKPGGTAGKWIVRKWIVRKWIVENEWFGEHVMLSSESGYARAIMSVCVCGRLLG
jgi:hypothetical protein